jgi:hypothetical protein
MPTIIGTIDDYVHMELENRIHELQVQIQDMKGEMEAMRISHSKTF